MEEAGFGPTWDSDDEIENFIQKMNPPRVVIDNESCSDATVVQVDSANKNGILHEVVQVLIDLNLIITKAYISFDGEWFMDVFNVTDQDGRKITDEKVISNIEDYIRKNLLQYSSVRQGVESRGTPEQSAGATSSSMISQTPALDEFHAPPRPLPFDDPQFSKHVHHKHGCASSPRKSSSQCIEICKVVRSTKDDIELVSSGDKLQGSSLKNLRAAVDAVTKIYNAVDHEVCSSSEDDVYSSDVEDDCPICLEEYTPENPKKQLQCSHQFHLSCILEWMERSEACPVCAKIMLFEENDR